MKPIDSVAVKLEEDAEILVSAVIDQAKAGDWRAAAWLYDRVCGRPNERVELTDRLKTKPLEEMDAAEVDRLLVKLLAEDGELFEENGRSLKT